MNALGNLGQMYLFILLALLIVGAGFAAWGFIDNMTKKIEKVNKDKQLKIEKGNDTNVNNKINGGTSNIMNNNGWLKLTVFSFVGILISVALLGFIGTNGSNQNNAAMQMNNGQINTTQMSNGQMNMQNGNMNNNTSMNTMGSQNNQMNSQDQLQQMQQQLQQMQQQMNNIQNGNMNNNQQNNSNMQQMPQNSTNTQQNNSSSGSSSSMPMM